jgi:hypothetical protein
MWFLSHHLWVSAQNEVVIKGQEIGSSVYRPYRGQNSLEQKKFQMQH